LSISVSFLGQRLTRYQDSPLEYGKLGRGKTRHVVMVLDHLFYGRQGRAASESTVAILWPEQPLIPVTSHKLAVSRTDHACLSAKANWFYFNNLQNDSSRGDLRIRRFSIFKPGFDSR
jgi:hypothetical protein